MSSCIKTNSYNSIILCLVFINTNIQFSPMPVTSLFSLQEKKQNIHNIVITIFFILGDFN